MKNKQGELFSQNADQHEALLQTLETRFAANARRHPDVAWQDVRKRLIANPQALQTLSEMERTGGEPDVVNLPCEAGRIFYCDCSAETPEGRRSLCYDEAALNARKANKPEGSAVGMATGWGATLIDEEQYRAHQAIEPLDRKTSSWLRTPDAMRALGGALFGDRRFDRVFVYHNGADSYYGGRAFRVWLTI